MSALTPVCKAIADLEVGIHRLVFPKELRHSCIMAIIDGEGDDGGKGD